MSLERELGDVLRDLVREPGIVAAAISRPGEDPWSGELDVDTVVLRAPLGGEAELVVRARPQAEGGLGPVLERGARELRLCLRRWGAETPPECSVGLGIAGGVPRTRAAVVRRIERYLEAFAATHGATAVCILRQGRVVARGGAWGENLGAGLPFLVRRLGVEAARQRGRTSHAEIVADDVYAASFWFDAAFVAFFGPPYPVDFVRHRARAVMRELAPFLPHLDDDPPEPAKLAPRPR